MTDPQNPIAAPDTVTEAIDMLVAAGYTADFAPRADALHCSVCAQPHRPTDGIVERIFRFEGTSNPDDEAIVIGLRCPRCGQLGVLVSAYGRDADPEVIELMLALRDGRGER